jgi:hypothetical protein
MVEQQLEIHFYFLLEVMKKQPEIILKHFFPSQMSLDVIVYSSVCAEADSSDSLSPIISGVGGRGLGWRTLVRMSLPTKIYVSNGKKCLLLRIFIDFTLIFTISWLASFLEEGSLISASPSMIL